MARPRSPNLTILEGHWFPSKHVSVRDLLLPLFTVWTKSGDAAYDYDKFNNEHSFCDAITYAFRNGAPRTIYVAAHGSPTKLHGRHEAAGISRTVIKNALKGAPIRRPRGMYFGSCSFGTADNAALLLRQCRGLAWVAGFDRSVDWIDSSVLDLFFLRHYLFPDPVRGKRRPVTQPERLFYAIDRVVGSMGDLANKAGFHAFVRTKGGNGVRDLLES